MTTANRIRLQDEIICALNSAAGEDVDTSMKQLNVGNKNPPDLLEETRRRWQAIEQHISGSCRGRSRGRGHMSFD